VNWQIKSAGFKLLSFLPGGGRLYTYFQEHFTKSTLATRGRVDQKLKVGLGYWSWLKQNNLADIINEKLLDLGAGWHPTIPLLWYALGTKQQVLLDVFPNMNANQVRDTVRFFRELVNEPRWPERESVRRLPEIPLADGLTTDSTLKPLGIQYHAPYPGVLTSQRNTFGAVFCTQVLQHIPKSVQLAIFKELHQCLRPRGVFLATVHLVGQFRSPHLSTGQYEHLKYSPWFWEKIVNSTLMGFNRLKSPDYRETLEQAGFRIRAFDVQWPTAADLAELKHTRIHPAFRHYSERELAARHLFFVAEKP